MKFDISVATLDKAERVLRLAPGGELTYAGLQVALGLGDSTARQAAYLLRDRGVVEILERKDHGHRGRGKKVVKVIAWQPAKPVRLGLFGV